MKYKIGEIVGKYIILGYNDNPHSRTYITKCLKCGYINKNTQVGVLKNTNPICSHGRHTWKNPNLAWKFASMKRRCYNKNSPDYKNYGGRGIKICDEWLEDPLKFEAWAIETGFKPGLEIDRIDNDKGYGPDNCRWVTKSFNVTHRRVNILYTVRGKSLLPWQWNRELDLPDRYIYNLRDKGFTKEMIEQRLADVMDGKVYIRRFKITRRVLTVNNETRTINEWAHLLGLHKKQLNGVYDRYGKDGCEKFIYDRLKTIDGKFVVKYGE